MLFVGPFLATGCQINPETGESQFNLISPQQEIQLGNEVDRQVQQEFDIYENERVNEYVSRVGQKMARQASWQQPDYRFGVVRDENLNAFALPGGPIYISTGLLDRMENEAQLAGVLGHEVAHISARHHSQSMSRQLGYSTALQAVTAAVDGTPNDSTRQVMDLVFTVVNRGFSREQEMQSDQLGLHYMVQADYDPKGLRQLMVILANEGGSTTGLGQIFATHPSGSERIAQIDALIQQRYSHTQQNSRYALEPESYRSHLRSLR